MPRSKVRSGPGWGAFTVLAMLLIAAGVVGFGAIWLRMDQMQLDAEASAEELTAARNAIADAQARIEDQLTQASGLTTDVKTLASTITDLGDRVRFQDQRILDSAAVRETVAPSLVTVRCGRSQGSGFAVPAVGAPTDYPTTVLTNFHVVAECAQPGGAQVSVQQDGGQPPALVAKVDPANDLAALFIGADMPPLSTAVPPTAGDPALAVGSPFGQANMVTSGSITDVADGTYTTDAAVGPGNSGGPLVDRYGAAIGIVSAQLQHSEGHSSVIPVSLACATVLAC